MNKAKHTLIPYKLDGDKILARTVWQDRDMVEEAVFVMATIKASEFDKEFIVRACNSYDKLVKALTELLAKLQCTIWDEKNGESLIECIDIIRRTLKQAKE